MTYDHAQCAVDRLVMLADLRDLIQLLDRRLAEIQLEYPLSEFAVSIDKLRNQTLDLMAELQKSLERSRVPPHSLVPRRPVVPSISHYPETRSDCEPFRDADSDRTFSHDPDRIDVQHHHPRDERIGLTAGDRKRPRVLEAPSTDAVAWYIRCDDCGQVLNVWKNSKETVYDVNGANSATVEPMTIAGCWIECRAT